MFNDLMRARETRGRPASVSDADRPNDLIAQERALREAAELRANTLLSEKSLWEQLAQDEERERLELAAEFEVRIEAIRAEARAQTPVQIKEVASLVTAATQQLALDEDETRAIIDGQLREAGWEADSRVLRFSKGARPETGKNQAIAEWPTTSGPADYVLFRGFVPLAVVEAKRFSLDVSTVVEQAERYSLRFAESGGATLPSPTSFQASQGPFSGWRALQLPPGSPAYRIPFDYATNGRAPHRQVLTKSGV